MFERLTPTVRTLLIANLAMFAAQTFYGEHLFAPLELWPWHSALFYGGPPFEPWQLVTYGFLHFEFWHWFGNMLGLWMFGSAFESAWGTRRFLELFSFGVVGAAIITIAASYAHVLGSPTTRTVMCRAQSASR